MAKQALQFGLFDYTEYISARAANFAGRDWVFQAIDRWLSLPEAERFFLLTGEPGSGKSAIAARLAQITTGQAAPPARCPHLMLGFLQAAHFCRANAADWINPRTFTNSIARQLASIAEFNAALERVLEQMAEMRDTSTTISGQVQADTIQSGGSAAGVIIQTLNIKGASDQDIFTRAILDPLRAMYQDGYAQPLILLIDSLDEALATSTKDTITSLLGMVQGLDPRVRFIVTSRPETRVDTRLGVPRRVSLSDQARKAEYDGDITRFVKARLTRSIILKAKAALLSPAQAAEIPETITRKAEGNFQYVTFLLDAIMKGQQRLDNLEGLPSGLDSLYRASLARVISLGFKDWASVYKPFLAVLCVAQEPLPLNLIQDFSNPAIDPWDIYIDLVQFVEVVRLKRPAGEPVDPEKRYRIYHQSMIDFLYRQEITASSDGQEEDFPNPFYINSHPWHERIIDSCTGPAGDWAQVKWDTIPLYLLRYLTAHLEQRREVAGYRARLHALLETRVFLDQHLARLDKPYLLADDLRQALSLALADSDLAQAWRHIREYRRILRAQLDFENFAKAVNAENLTGNYVHVLENTALFGYMPYAQALARLWAAWLAAIHGYTDTAQKIIKTALERLQPRSSVQVSNGDDAVAIAIQRLLIRIAQSAEPSLAKQHAWLGEAIAAWPPADVAETLEKLSEPLLDWGRIVNAQQTTTSIQEMLAELRDSHRYYADANFSFMGERVYESQKMLAAGLFNSRGDPGWIEHVKQTAALLGLDDYPSYREMALAWVAAVVLAQENPQLAQQALALVIGGIFKPSPGFWGETVVAALAGKDQENTMQTSKESLLATMEEIEALGERSVDASVYHKRSDLLAWRQQVGLPEDPWSFSMRRRSAVAAVLYRRSDPLAATMLQQASEQGPEGSYAGYRALARLSLAFRWLEWGSHSKALDALDPATEDAHHIKDSNIMHERVAFVEKARQWILQFGQATGALTEADALAQLARMSGQERGLFIEFLSALWAKDAARQKRLLPLALDDATTADAVLGRLLGLEAKDKRPGTPFSQLVAALRIEEGIERN